MFSKNNPLLHPGQPIDPQADNIHCVVTVLPGFEQIYCRRGDTSYNVLAPGLNEYIIKQSYTPDGKRRPNNISLHGSFAIFHAATPDWWKERDRE